MMQAQTPKPAATLVLLRREPRGFSVLLMKRPSRSSFMGGMHVFPGGKVEETDRPAELDIAQRLCARMQLSAEACGAFLQAACRETLEEVGLSIAHDALVYFDHWITPEIEPKRFDTRFFAAEVPGHAAPVPNEEAISWGFYAPAQALEMIAAGEMAMAPPTLVTMQRLQKFESLDDALRALGKREVGPLLPELASTDPITLALPGHPAHPDHNRVADNPTTMTMLDGKWHIHW